MLNLKNVSVKLFWLIPLVLSLCDCESVAVRKTILIIGETGVGKSYIGNKLLETTAFHTSANINSTTKKIQSHIKTISLPQEHGLMDLEVVDTPGIGDTDGESIEFLDKIVEYIRTHTINIIAIVVKHDKITDTFRNYLIAMKECLARFNDATTILIVNKATPEEQLRENTGGPQSIEALTAQMKSEVFKALNCSHLANVVAIPFLANTDTWKLAVERIWNMIRVSGEVNKKDLKTWTETLAFYKGIVDGKISVDEHLKWRISQLNTQKEGLESDIQYNQKRIDKIVNVEIPATIWLPIAGPLTAMVLSLERDNCEKKIRQCESEKKQIVNELSLLNGQKVNAQAELLQATKKLNYMNGIFGAGKNKDRNGEL
jgi:GTP-binding protein EngB required for normal cell division